MTAIEKEHYSRTANTIHMLLQQGDYVLVRKYISIFSVLYLIEVYRLLSKEDKQMLLDAIENNLI